MSGRLWAIAAVFLAFAAGARAGELASGDVVLSLAGACRPTATANDGRPEDLELEFVCRDGVWQKDVWGFAPGLNYLPHHGDLAAFERKGEALQLAVKLELAGDAQAPGGAAEFSLELKRNANEFTGAYSGKFLDSEVKGSVHGILREPVARPVAGFKPLAAQEHPRLIFRKQDLPELQRRMETPEGKAIRAMLDAAPMRTVEQVDDRRSSWIAANWGVVYQLTGDQEAAAKARRILVDEVVRKPMPIDRADIHLATRLLGVALAFDLCYDAWDEEFRGLAAEYLHLSMAALLRGYHQGLVMEDIRPEPWSHRNAVRMGAVGCAALALLGEKGPDGALDADARKAVGLAQREVLRYLRSGISPSGWCVEGDFYKKFALANGLLQFMHAARTALGTDLSAANPNLLAGYLPAADPLKQNASGVGVRALQVSGLWPMGFGTLPAEFLPVMKGCFDREAGLAGPKHFDCTYPYQVAYALMNYPFGVEAMAPGGALPLVVSDPVTGHYVFRNAWSDGNDFLTIANLRSGAWPGLQRQYTGKAFELQITGLGRKWFSGPVGVPERNPFFGAETLAFEQPGPGKAVLTGRLDRAFLAAGRAAPARGGAGALARPPTGEGARGSPPTLPWGADQPLSDTGLKGTRHFAVDYTGACGAPALFVLVDRLENAAQAPWDLGLKDAVFNGAQFTLGEAAGPNLRGAIVAPANARGGKLRGSSVYFVVFTIQNGAPPALKITGEGLKAQVTIGGQTVSFDGEKVVFGK